MNNVLPFIQASLLGGFIGDGLGQPVETLTARSINRLTKGKGVVDFIKPLQQRIAETRDLEPGAITDDSQLTITVLKALCAAKGYDQEIQARFHVKALEESTVGWGRTTQHSLAEIKLYFESEGREGRSPHQAPTPKPGRGAGNGVAIKVAPVAYANVLAHNGQLEPIRLFEDVLNLATLTHAEPDAFYSALFLALMHGSVLQTKCLFNLGPLDTEKITFLLQKFLEVILRANIFAHTNQLAPAAQPILEQMIKTIALIGDFDRLEQEITPGFKAIQSVPYSLGIFATYPNDFSLGVLTAVNAGLDADSTAAMVGSLIGLNCGLGAIPEEWKTFHPSYAQAFTLGEELYHSFP